MSSEALLAVIGVLIALYSILPAERRLDLHLRLGRFDWCLAIAALASLHYISYFPVLDSLGIALPLGPWRWGFTADSTSYLIVIGTVGIIWIRASRARLTVTKLPQFARLVEQLIASGHSSDLAYLLERDLGSLEEIERRLRPAIGAGPTMSRSHDVLRDVLRRLLTTRGIVSEIAVYRPALAARLGGLEVWDRWEFLELLVRTLLDRQHSPLYYEIEHNQNLRSGHRYAIPPSNVFLTFFLSDAQRAHDLRIYGYFGDYALGELTRLSGDAAGARYNAALGDYHERERWSCPVHSCIRVFDIMLSEALHQGVRSHMWLYYFPLFAERIVSNLSPRLDVDLMSEWPTPYHYLLYDVVGTLCGLLEESTSIPATQANIAVTTVDLEADNTSIAKSAAIVLGQVLRRVLVANGGSGHFKTYLVGIALRNAEKLRLSGRVNLATVVSQSIAEGGPGYHTTQDEYPEQLVEALRGVDWLLREKFRADPHLATGIAASR